MSSKSAKETYQVGFGKPPVRTQFKAGRSGNPQGRPKGALNVRTVLKRVLEEQVVINENGKRRTITKLEASFKQVTNKAANGDLGAIRLLLPLLYSADETSPQKQPTKADLTDSDLKTVERMWKRLEKSQKEKSK
jgi:hypothetical protein